MRRVCVVTGSRAEYGLLSNLLHKIRNSSNLLLQIVATNMHLSPEFGLTYKEIEKDGFVIDKFVEMLLSSDSAVATAKSVGIGVLGFADVYRDLRPDVILVLGDRFEILSAVTSALFLKIPVAHIHGGEITEGAYDDSIRHAITKMSHLHFTSTEMYRRRVIQLGESPTRVFNVGALGVENAIHESFQTKTDLEKDLDFVFTDKSLLITFHPVTLENYTAEWQIDNLLTVLSEYSDYRLLFTMPNSDTDSRVIMAHIKTFVEQNKKRAKVFVSLGKKRYLSALKYVSAVVGNSSSGIIEVPSFGIPTLNIGDRQKGRISAPSVVHCGNSIEDIKWGFKRIFSTELRRIAQMKVNPYQKENTSGTIVSILETCDLNKVIKKEFYDLKSNYEE